MEQPAWALPRPFQYRRLRARPNETTELPPYDGPYYVVFNAAGGWDTTYLMDPKGIGGINRLYKEGDILTQGPHRFAPNAAHIESGLSNEDFFKKYGDELLVLHGLDYSVNNHDPLQAIHGNRQTRQPGVPDIRRLGRGMQGIGSPIGVSDVW